jgi:hypothetical protein
MPREDFTLDDPGYSPEKFYVKATDSKGHSANLRVHVPPIFAERVSALIASRTFPEYRTLADFVRDAMYHRLYQLEHRLYQFGVPDGLAMLAIKEEALRLDHLLDEAQATVATVSKAVQRMVRLGQEQTARAIVQSAVESLPDHPAVRAAYWAGLKSEFGAWIAGEQA